MTWRGTTKIQDKIFAALTYLIPVIEALRFGVLIFALFPPLALLFIPLFLLMPIYFFGIGGLAIVEFGMFIALYLLVVQNPRHSHFLRFNTLQALLISILAFLCDLVLDFLGFSQELLNPLAGRNSAGVNFLPEYILPTVIFIGVMGASVYAIVQCLRGVYAEIPVISEAAYNQVR